MLKKEFDNFFRPYSKNVDAADTLYFWKLSDRIILEVIRKYIPASTLTKDSRILDAGGGTGRWVHKLSQEYPASFTLYDLSSDMLEQAEKNIHTAGIQDRVELIEGDLADMQAIANDSIDHVVSIYSPLSFVDDPLAVTKELHRIVKPGGRVLIMGHGFYNALYSKITNYNASSEELQEITKERMVKWAPFVPKLHLFSKDRMENLLIDSGFQILTTYGIPSFTQPGMEDFDQNNLQHSRISNALEKDRDFFEEVVDLELKYSNLPEIANRGVNIFSVGQK